MTRSSPILAAAATVAALSLSLTAARATEIIALGETSADQFVVTNPTATTTHIAVNAAPIDVTLITASSGLSGAVPFAATLTLSANNNGAAAVAGGEIIQSFSGTFSIDSALCHTNCLSGSFTDSVTSPNGSTGLTLDAGQPPTTLSFTSSVIPASDLGVPTSLSFSVTNFTPASHTTGSPETLGAGAGTVTGDASATTHISVPEPASLALLGLGLVGLGMARRKRS